MSPLLLSYLPRDEQRMWGGSLTAEGKAAKGEYLSEETEITWRCHLLWIIPCGGKQRIKELLRLPSRSRDWVLPHQSPFLTLYPSPAITVNSHTQAHHHGCGLSPPCKSSRCWRSVSHKLCPHHRASSCTCFASCLHADAICSLSLAHTLPLP